MKIKIKSSNRYYHFNTGNALFKLGKYEEALAEKERAEELRALKTKDENYKFYHDLIL